MVRGFVQWMRSASLAVFALAVVLAAPVVAQDACEGVACNSAGPDSSVRVGYTQFPPFSSVSTTGVAEGYSIDLIRLLLEPKGYSITFVPFANPADMLAALRSGEIDVTSILADNPARREVGTFTDYVGSFEIRLFSADDRPVPATTGELTGLSIGAAKGSIGYRLASELEGVNLVALESSGSALLPLLTGEVDLLAGSTESIRFIANRAGLSHRVMATDFILRESSAALLVNRDATALVADLNNSIAEAFEHGRISGLYKDWFGTRSAPVTLRERYALSAALLVALGVLGYWARLHYIVLKRARRMEARSELLAEGLDATGQSLVILDTDMRPVLWNASFEQDFPRQVPLLRKGLDLESLVAAAHQNGSFQDVLPEDKAQEIARSEVCRLKSGGEVVDLRQVPGGRVLRMMKRMLPHGQFAVLAADVTDLINAQQDLEDARSDLESSNMRLAEFNRIAAHDLIAPLRNVRNLHEWIRDDLEEAGLELDAETLENFESIDTLLQRQAKMIEDLLAYSTPSTMQTSEPFDPVSRFSSVLELSNIPKGFRIVMPTQVPQLLANPTAFDIVLRNLISNAVKHHDRRAGFVEVRTEVGDRMCTFEVRDDGPGIPEASLEKVFEPFTRLKSRDEGAGSGLGLAFIKRRVEEWGGTVEAISKDGSRGTIFRFDVPLAEPSADATVTAPVERRYSSISRIRLA